MSMSKRPPGAIPSGLASTLERAGELRAGVEAVMAEDGHSDDHRRQLQFASARLWRSVIRPLREALEGTTGQVGETNRQAVKGTNEPTAPRDAGTTTAQPSVLASGQAPRVLSDGALVALAWDATRLRVAANAPTEVQEATAALQDLALRFAPDETRDPAHATGSRFWELMASLPRAIQSETNGPYLVTNADNVTDWLGCRLAARPQMALCRCGHSRLKPLCDGTHAEIGFRGAKDPQRVADRQDTYVGQQVTILDNRGTCQHSGLCTDRIATAFRLGQEPFVMPSGGRMDELIRAVRDCPSGALSYALDGIEARDEVDYHGKREPTIEVTKDGPYRVRGGIPLIDGDGNPESPNQGASLEHYALCRCGQSQNKPFCSGMHWYVEFKDPVADPDQTPTMFEWCGGLPVLTRMTRLFYEKYVPQDPMLAPLFSNMSADHPQRVAKWLAEVFGGPPFYSQEYGGYSRMLAQHIGKRITEEWRTRWVELLMKSAREAGMPNDPEFASAFQAYIQWGSRLAFENSQTNSRPPEQMPMPHWDWTTGAGPPGSRMSALAPSTEDPPVVLPAADEPVRFEKHIKALFRARDRQSMKFAFDLWNYEDVSNHAEAILERVHNGTMPCDGAWPPEKVEAFERWTTTGMTK